MVTPVLRVRIPRSCPLSGVDPLYLFACQVEFRKRCSQAARKELLFALLSSNAESRLVAEALLEACP